MSTSRPIPPPGPGELSGARYDTFVCTARLGAGSGGEVWRAWDTRLSRWVALKVLKTTDPEELARLRREAQTAASLDHPGIVKVFAVGENWIAMELMSGSQLGSEIPTPSRTARLVRDAALAVAYANSRGVIHRDLKPPNLMVDDTGRVRVLDFGLARQVGGGSTITVTGEVTGTPAYMSPEQARGDTHAVDARSDVYGLGATLYHLLTGRAPFRGERLLEVLDRVQTQDPVPPWKENAAIPRDLGIICLKCLEKDPSRRYASAEELASDLGRYLEGEPVRARPVSIVYRLRRQVARRRGPVAAGVIALAVIGLVVAGVALRLGREADILEGAAKDLERREARLTDAQRALIERMRQSASLNLEAMLAKRRVGDVAGMREFALRAQALCREVSTELPGLAEPHVLLGRLHRARMQFEEAFAEQEEAVRLDPSDRTARYERGLLGLRRYEERIRRLRASWRLARAQARAGEEPGLDASPDRRELEDEDAVALRRQAAEDLKASAHPLTEGLLAYLDSDPRTAGLLESAMGERPDAVEGWEYLALCESTSGRLEAAERWLTTAIARDVGYRPLLELRIFTRLELARMAAIGGGDPLPATRRAVEDADRLVELDREDAAGWRWRAQSRMDRMSYGFDAGELPAILGDLDRALSLAPEDAEARMLRALAWNNAGTRMTEPERAESAFLEAISEYDEVERRDPASPQLYRLRASARYNLARSRLRVGSEVGPVVEAAVRDLDRALHMEPGSAQAWIDRASLRVIGGHRTMTRSDVEAANADLQRAQALDVRGERTLIARASLLSMWASSPAAVGLDTQALHAEALELAGRAVRLWPDRSLPRIRRAEFLINRALTAGQGLEDRERDYREAIAELTRAIERPVWNESAWFRRGDAASQLFQLLHVAGRPEPALRDSALADYAEALRRNPFSGEARLGRAKLHANDAVMRRRPPVDAFRDAIADFEEALRWEPTRGDGWVGLASARVGVAANRMDRPADAAEMTEQAIGEFGRALRLDGSDAQAWAGRGNARALLMLLRGRLGDEKAAADLYVELQKDFAEALRLDPRSADARLRRGKAHFVMQAWSAALADFLEAERLDPSLGPQVAALISRCRRELER